MALCNKAGHGRTTTRYASVSSRRGPDGSAGFSASPRLPGVKRLFALASADAGISRVQFLNVAQSTSHVDSARQHPLSDLLYEHVVTSIDAEGRFAIDHSLERATPVLALWHSSDGDDTSSTFSVTLDRIELE